MATSIAEKFESMEYGPAPEDATEVLRWLDANQRRFGHFINGAWTSPASPSNDQSFHPFPVTNPATGETLATVACAGPTEVDLAVQAARSALRGWQALTSHQRARYLYALTRQVQKHSRRLAVLETLDNGKSIRESRDIDIPLVARHFYHHAGWAQLLDAEFPGYAPVGVVGQIIPWNFPLLMFAWKIAPALAAGCTVVIKPAESTPLTALAMAEIAAEVGLPPGVLNVILGDGRTGAAIVAHPGIDKIAFTGSTEVGRSIRKTTANTRKKLSLELGGKSPFVVFDDADLDSAVEGLVDGIWFNQGQVCCAGSRLLVQERVAERLYDKLRARMQTLRVGSPLDKAIDIGAIVDHVQYDRIASLVQTGINQGATCYQPQTPLPECGLFFRPTLLTNVSPSATVAQQEIFGPVLVAMTFRTPSEAVELANNTTYGLAASVWSENINLALDVASQIKAGVVWVNAINLFDAASGFGGYRESGYGREGGSEGMLEYLEPRWLHAQRTPSSADASQATLVPPQPIAPVDPPSPHATDMGEPSIDRTVKQYIGGKQSRPDSGYSFPVHDRLGHLVDQAPLGNRKDIRNAVEAASAATKWARTSAHARAQVLYFIAENLAQRQTEISARLAAFVTPEQAALELDVCIERTFTYAAWADKFEGSVHNPLARMVTLAMKEPVGVIAIIAPDQAPLLSLLSLILPAIAMGNTVVAVPSPSAATLMGELYQVFDTSDLPGGVVNLVAGNPAELGKTLAEHDGIDAIWSFRDAATATMAKAASIGNLKQVFTSHGSLIDWFDPAQSQGRWFLHHATQVKNIWIPYGE
ncbi:MAG: aldehyde dehydrogenase family protein [Acidobacteriaceae bacterium]